MMKPNILAVADIHENPMSMEWTLSEAKNYELIILAGDLLTNSNGEEKKIKLGMEFLTGLAEITPVVFCSGNHDVGLVEALTAESVPGLTMDGGTCDLQGVRIGAAGTPDELTSFAGQDLDILVYHKPPKGTPTSRDRMGSEYGCETLALMLEFMDPKPGCVVSGHVHDPQSTHTTFQDVTILNSGQKERAAMPHYMTLQGASKHGWSVSIHNENEETIEIP